MNIKLDLSKEYGIVLEGGGAKGAYQIGAWKALAEAGIKIKGISGVSVGALNGALMCMDQLEEAQRIWENIDYSQVIDLEDRPIRQFKRILKDHGLDVSPLKKLIQDTVDEEVIKRSARDLYITTYSVSDRKLLTVDIKEIEQGQMADFLIASAYFLAFKNEKLHGKRYLDGGGFDNVPIQILLDKEYQDIIIIRIYGLGFDSEKKVKIPEDTNVYHIAPRSHLGGILQFEAKTARKNLLMGYYDGMRLLYGLSGKQFYIDTEEEEVYYFDKLMKNISIYLPYLDIDEAEITGIRSCTEQIFPELAYEFSLDERWDYKILYLTVLETLARKLRFNRFCIYTEVELAGKINENLKLLDS